MSKKKDSTWCNECKKPKAQCPGHKDTKAAIEGKKKGRGHRDRQ